MQAAAGQQSSSDSDENIDIEIDTSCDVNKISDPKYELYKPTDKQPYHVNAEFKNDTNALELGKLLHKYQIKSITRIDTLSKLKARITLTDWKQANKMMKLDGYEDLKPFVLTIPSTYVHSEGIIRDVPINFTDEEIRKYSKSSAPITSCVRLTYWNHATQKAIPSTTIKVTFRANKVPEEVYCYYTVFKVAPYIQKPLFCRNCLSYGHFKKYCKSQQLSCKTCTEPAHDSATSCAPKCKHCTDGINADKHITNAKTCPEFINQFEIKKTMTINKITFREAKLKIKKMNPTPAETKNTKQSYASVVQGVVASSTKSNISEPKQQKQDDLQGKFIINMKEILQQKSTGPGNTDLTIKNLQMLLRKFLDESEAGTSHAQTPNSNHA